MEQFLEDRVQKLTIIVASVVVSASGGFLSGFFQSSGLHPEYQNLLAYGPAAFVGTLSGVYYGLEQYTKELKTPRSEDVFSSASKAAAFSVLLGSV